MSNIRTSFFTRTIGFIIRTLQLLNMRSYAWPLRRLYTNVDLDALVLEVGSGGNPYPRSNVLVDAFEETKERHWEPLSKDRPTIIGFVENLPFKDKVFDYVIACHVLEHSLDPARFLTELQRVAKAGYIEVPNSFFERSCPYHDHRLEIMLKEKKLFITKKSGPVHDKWFNSALTEAVRKEFGLLYKTKPELLHICLHWRDSIDFEVLNPDQEFFDTNASPIFRQHKLSIKALFKRKMLAFLSNFDRGEALVDSKKILDILRCPSCHEAQFSEIQNDKSICDSCGSELKVFISEKKTNETRMSVPLTTLS